MNFLQEKKRISTTWMDIDKYEYTLIPIQNDINEVTFNCV